MEKGESSLNDDEYQFVKYLDIITESGNIERRKIDITDDHPSTLVNKDNYRNLTVGVVTSKGRQDNDHVAVSISGLLSDDVQ